MRTECSTIKLPSSTPAFAPLNDHCSLTRTVISSQMCKNPRTGLREWSPSPVNDEFSRRSPQSSRCVPFRPLTSSIEPSLSRVARRRLLLVRVQSSRDLRARRTRATSFVFVAARYRHCRIRQGDKQVSASRVSSKFSGVCRVAQRERKRKKER